MEPCEGGAARPLRGPKLKASNPEEDSDDLPHALPILGAFVSVAAVGLVLSRRMARGLHPDRLRRGFGIFLLVVAAVTLLQEALARL